MSDYDKSIRELAEERLEEARESLAKSQIGLIEAKVLHEAARLTVVQLEGAVAALSLETLESEVIKVEIEPEPPFDPPDGPLKTAEGKTRVDPELSREEFEIERRKRQRKIEQKQIDDNPHGTLRCPGCGKTGYMTENIMTTKAGGTLRALVCGKCSNQQMI